MYLYLLQYIYSTKHYKRIPITPSFTFFNSKKGLPLVHQLQHNMERTRTWHNNISGERESLNMHARQGPILNHDKHATAQLWWSRPFSASFCYFVYLLRFLSLSFKLKTRYPSIAHCTIIDSFRCAFGKPTETVISFYWEYLFVQLIVGTSKE